MPRSLQLSGLALTPPILAASIPQPSSSIPNLPPLSPLPHSAVTFASNPSVREELTVEAQIKETSPYASTWTANLLSVLVLHLICGCGYTLSLVWQNNLVLRTSFDSDETDDIVPERMLFYHPLIQAWLVLLGQAANLPVGLALRWYAWRKHSTSANPIVELVEVEQSPTPRHPDSQVPLPSSLAGSTTVAASPITLRTSTVLTSPAVVSPQLGSSTLNTSTRRFSVAAPVSPPQSAAPPLMSEEEKDKHFKVRLFTACSFLLLTSLMEVLETSLCVLSLTLMDPSVFSMMRITQLIFATSIQVFLLPRVRNWQRQRLRDASPQRRSLTGREEEERAKAAKSVVIIPSVYFTRAQYFGLFCVVGGVVVVFLAANYESRTSGDSAQHNAGSVVLGSVFVLVAMMTLSLESALHEHVLTNYSDVIEPMELIGLQGVGCTVWMVCIIMFANIVTSDSYNDIVTFLAQVSDGWQGPLSVLSVIFCTTGVDSTGTYLTRAMTANVRPALQPLRSGIIWLVGLYTGASHYSSVRLVGFLTSAFGAMLFKQMIGGKSASHFISTAPPTSSASSNSAGGSGGRQSVDT